MPTVGQLWHPWSLRDCWVRIPMVKVGCWIYRGKHTHGRRSISICWFMNWFDSIFLNDLLNACLQTQHPVRFKERILLTVSWASVRSTDHGTSSWVGILALPHTLLGKLLNLLCLGFLLCKWSFLICKIIPWHTCRAAISNACRGLRTGPGMQRVVLLCNLWWCWYITIKAYKIANSF